MAIDKGFRRIVLSLMTLVTISVITVGAYLYFNFKSRSSLSVIVPKDVRMFMHFQTRKMRDESGVKQPIYMDSLASLVANSVLFHHLIDPSEAGISLYSDLVYFYSKEHSHCLALSLNSEQRFSRLLDTLKMNEIVGKQMVTPSFNYAKFKDLPLYIAYKYKAMILVLPTIESKEINLSASEIESQMAKIFSDHSDGFIKNRSIQSLYDSDCQWIAWNGKDNPVGLCFNKGKSSAFEGFDLEAKAIENKSALIFAGMRPNSTVDSSRVENTNLNYSGVELLDVYFKDVYEYLKNGEYGY